MRVPYLFILQFKGFKTFFPKSYMQYVLFFSEKFVRYLQWKNLELNIHLSCRLFNLM